MKHTTLGKNGPAVSQIGLGCMAMSNIYGPSDEAESIATIHAALDAGINLIDTGDFYGMGHNELLVGKALTGRKRESAFVQVKFGAQRDPAGAWLGFDGRPAAVKTSLAYTLQRLELDYIDLYQPARLDPNVPIEETIGAVAEMIRAGYVRYAGVSELGAESIRRAHSAYPIVQLQIEYSLMSRSLERDVLPAVRELGIGVTAYGILSRGLLAGKTTATMSPGDYRAALPRWQGENQAKNLAMVAKLSDIAAEKKATTSQLALAWVLSRGSDIVPLAGARTRAQLADAVAAMDLELTADDLARIEASVPADSVAGERYGEHAMSGLDSER